MEGCHIWEVELGYMKVLDSLICVVPVGFLGNLDF